LLARAAHYEAIRDEELTLAPIRIMKRTGEDWGEEFGLK
jgi:hypothetical protein